MGLITGLVLLIGLAGALILPNQPKHSRLTLSECLQEYTQPSGRITEAAEVIRQQPKAAMKLGCKLLGHHRSRAVEWLNEQRWFRVFARQDTTYKYQEKGEAIFAILGTNGVPAIPKLRKLLVNNRTAFSAIRALREIQHPAILDPLLEAAASSDDQIAYHALAALYELPEPGLVGPLNCEQQLLVFRAMQHSNTEISGLACALTERFQFSPKPLLEDFVTTPHKYEAGVRLVVVQNLLFRGTNLCARTNLLPYVRVLLRDPNEKVAHAASVGLTRFEGCMQ